MRNASKGVYLEMMMHRQRLSYRNFMKAMSKKSALKTIVKAISYQTNEGKVLEMEDWLMNHMGYNRSQLHKQLVRKEYQTQRML